MSKLTKKFHHSPYPTISPTRPELSTLGKTVLITGGSSGIGFACAEAFAQSGAKHIILTSRTAKALEAAKEKLSTSYPKSKIDTFTTDISKDADVEAAFNTVRSEIGPIHIFIANAGYAPAFERIKDTDIDDFRRGVETNLFGTYLCTKYFARQIDGVPDPVLIHVSTGAAHAPPVGPWSGYGATKAAAAKVVDYFAYENPSVRVYTIHPGAIATNMTAGVDSLPLREDVRLPGSFCVWLASQEAVFLKGRFLWASWDVDELMAMKADFARNPSLARIGLKFPNSRL